MTRAVLVTVALCLLGADKPRNHHKATKPGPVLRPIPIGAIKIPLPDIERPDENSCGAASLMSICSYYGVGPNNVEKFEKKLHTTEEGIYYKNIARYAEKLGLKAEIEAPMSIERLKWYVDQGKPVICSLQAYSDDPLPDYTKNGDGHYVVAIGYDKEDNFYFMDPSAKWEGHDKANPRYACLTRQQLELRWHEDEGMKGEHEVYQRLGIVIFPDPKKAEPLSQARVMD